MIYRVVPFEWVRVPGTDGHEGGSPRWTEDIPNRMKSKTFAREEDARNYARGIHQRTVILEENEIR